MQELLDKLTPREIEVTNFLVQGLKNKEIGKCLGVSFRTVEVYRASIYEKLDVKNAVELNSLFYARAGNSPSTLAILVGTAARIAIIKKHLFELEAFIERSQQGS